MSGRRSPGRYAAPHCACHQALWDAYTAACDAYAARTDDDGPERYPDRPERVDGYCTPCYEALCRSGAPWPPEVWAYLHASAVPISKLVISKPHKLPGEPKARRESLAKLKARAAGVYSKGADTRCHNAIGMGCGAGWYIAGTNGYTALLQRGAATQDRNIDMMRPDGAWVDLPPDLHLALNRVRLLANERSNAVTLTVGPYGVVLSARCPEFGEASERVPLAGSSGDVPEFAVCLNAEYLDVVCGVWPLRWHLRPDEMLAQAFEPAGADWRGLIMPMRN